MPSPHREPAGPPFRAQVSDIDLRLLRVFRTVVDCRGFAAAERELNIGRSTISTHMADLEGRLGIRLCERGPGGFAVTDRGQKVYEAIGRLMSALENFRSDVGAIHGLVVGELTIGLIDNTLTDPNSPVRRVISRVRAISDQVHFNIQMLSPDALERAVADGRLHVGIVARATDHPALRYRPLYRERNLIYCGRGHPLFDRPARDLGLDDITAANFVSLGYKEAFQGLARDLRFNGKATSYNMEGVAMLILTGDYIGFLPDHYAKAWEARGLLRPLLPETVDSMVEMAVVTRKDHRWTLAMRTFIDVLMEERAIP
ncbi:MAG: LysR family transcriptional regulator [Rhodobacterales bacterium]|nr:LysR family transcriptional regulator [Rhodobacterales bacterium]